MKLKNDLKPQETEVVFKNIKSSDGDISIDEQDRKVKIIIYEDETPKTPEIEENEIPEESDNVKTGDYVIVLAIGLIIGTILLNILILVKNKKVKLIFTIGAIIILTIAISITVFAEDGNINEILERLQTKEKWLNSQEYLVTDDDISRILPNADVNELKQKFNKPVKIYKIDENEEIKVVDGKITTGMKVIVDDEKNPYQTIVVGDLDKDGESNQVELTTIIRNVIDPEKWELTTINKKAADMELDGNIDVFDINSSVKYIVYGELGVPTFNFVEAPKIDVIEGTYNETTNMYKDNIKVQINELEENAIKTMYKIEGTSNKIDYTKIENKGTIELTENGIYKISAYTYGQLGNRSEISSIILIKQEDNQLIIHHYEQGTTNKIVNDEIITLEKGDEYFVTNLISENNKIFVNNIETDFARNYLDINKYKYIGVDYDSSISVEENNQIKGVFNEDEIQITYYYSVNKYNITGEVIGGNGIISNVPQEVIYGENGINAVEIRPDLGYRVKSIRLYVGDEITGEYNEDTGVEIINFNEDEEYKVQLPLFINIVENKHIVVIFEPLPIVAQIIGVPVGSENLRSSDGQLILNHTYTSLKAALKDAEIANQNEGIVEIKILANIKNESNIIEDNNNIIIDLNGYTINSNNMIEEVLKIEKAEVVVKDTSEFQTGKITSTKTVAILVTPEGSFTLGEDDKIISLNSPYIQGVNYGVYKEVDESDNTEGIFNFYDGKIIGETAIAGNVDDTPLLYNATVVVEEDQIATLAIIADREAAIGKKTYINLEDAFSEANLIFGITGQEVEIDVIAPDITLEDTIKIEENRNIVLDLNGSTIVTTSNNSDVFENNGNFTIMDSNMGEYDLELYNITDINNGFINQNGKLISKNKANSSRSEQGVILDLTNETETVEITVNAEISARDVDYGYVKINEVTESKTIYEDSDVVMFLVKGIVEAQDYTVQLEGGKKYFMRIGYRKQNYNIQETGDNQFVVNSIKINGEVKTFGISYDMNDETGKIITKMGNLITNKPGAKFTLNSGILTWLKNEYSAQQGYIIENDGDFVMNGGLIKTEFNLDSDKINTESVISNKETGKIVINSGEIEVNSFEDFTTILNFGDVEINQVIQRNNSTFVANLGNLEIRGGYMNTILNQGQGILNIGNARIYNLTNKGIADIEGTKEIYYITNSGKINIHNCTVTSISNNGDMTATSISAQRLSYGYESELRLYDSRVTIIAKKEQVPSNCKAYIENCNIDSIESYVELTVKDCIINSKIDIGAGIVKILGKTEINSPSGNCINMSEGELIIGEKDGNIDLEYPKLNSNNKVVDSKYGKISYYDGILIGKKDNIIIGRVNEIEEGKEIIRETREDGLECLVLGEVSNNVAKISKQYQIIGENYSSQDSEYYYFNTLKDAFNSCSTTEDEKINIQIIQNNIDIIKQIIVSEGQNIELDLNSNTINIYNEIINNGKLEIIDNTEEKQGVINSTYYRIVLNNGSLKIRDGKINTWSEGGSSSKTEMILNNGTLNILGGEYISKGPTTIIRNNNNGTLDITGGTLQLEGYAMYGLTDVGIINNSEILVNIENLIINKGEAIYNNSSGEININNINIDGRYGIYNNSNGKINIENSIIKAYNLCISNKNSGEIFIKDTTISDNGAITNDINSYIKIESCNINYKDEINNLGKMDIKETEIKNNTNFAEIKNKGELNLEFVNIYAKGRSSNAKIINQTGTDSLLTIKGGSIADFNSTYLGYAIYISEGTLIIGEKGGVPNKTEPEIVGKTYGVYINSGGIFNFYDGIIKGEENKSIYGEINELEDGYEIIKETISGMESSVLDRFPMVEIVSTGEEYFNIQSAIEAVGNDTQETLKMLRSVTFINMAESILINEDKNIILDLNGYEIQSSNENTFINNGTFEIISSERVEINGETPIVVAQEGAGKLINYSNNVIMNNSNAILNLTSGEIKGVSNGTEESYKSIIENSGLLNIQGVTITSDGDFKNIIKNNNEMYLKSGSILTSKIASWTTHMYGIYNTTPLAKVFIEGGKISSPNCGIYNGIIKMTGGEISAYDWGVYISEEVTGKIELLGGKISAYSQGREKGSVYNNSNTQVDIKNTIENYVLNQSTGTINILENATINGQILNAGTGTINIEGSNININGRYGSSYWCYYTDGNGGMGCTIGNYAGIINIKSGNITSESSGKEIYNLEGTINIGTNDDNINKTEPNIVSNKSYSIINTSGIVNYYDGTITGKIPVIGDINEIATNAQIIITQIDGIKSYSIDNSLDVASITKNGETKTYKTISEAVEECEDSNNTTIKILTNIAVNISNSININNNKDISIDLNGKEIISNYFISNNGKLEIKDDSEESSGKILGRGKEYSIENSKELIITSGTFYNAPPKPGFNTQIIKNNDNGKITMNGGVLELYIESTNIRWNYN